VASNLPQTVTGGLRISSEPDMALISLLAPDATEFKETEYFTPHELTDLQTGTWEVQVTKDGYETAGQIVEVRENDTLPVTITLSELLRQGYLAVKTEPMGARVSVRKTDSADEFKLKQGTTPITDCCLSVGSWDILVELDSYKSETINVAITHGDTVQPPLLKLSSIPRTGYLDLSSTPTGATVALREHGQRTFENIGSTHLAIKEILAGNWDIRFRKSGYEDDIAPDSRSY